ncbi:hypothetical protein P9166_13770 [Lactococcus lactis]|nr:hypothetical protein P9166_13770 [Lactococcus lactis]
MSDFNQDIQNLLNAYDSNWEDYLILREQFIEKYSLSVENLQEIRITELKDFNSKILQAELKNQKLQKEIDAAKKYIEESYKADKEDNKLLDLIIEAVAKLKSDNETLKKALTEISKSREDILSGRCLITNQPTNEAIIALDALAAIGGDDE